VLVGACCTAVCVRGQHEVYGGRDNRRDVMPFAFNIMQTRSVVECFNLVMLLPVAVYATAGSPRRIRLSDAARVDEARNDGNSQGIGQHGDMNGRQSALLAIPPIALVPVHVVMGSDDVKLLRFESTGCQ
jgi:hypothetical protein